MDMSATPLTEPETAVILVFSMPPGSIDKNSNFTLQVVKQLNRNNIKLTKTILLCFSTVTNSGWVELNP